MKKSLKFNTYKSKATVNAATKLHIKRELRNDTVLHTFLKGITQYGEIGHRVRFGNPKSIEIATVLNYQVIHTKWNINQ